jgi:hypothetical protein
VEYLTGLELIAPRSLVRVLPRVLETEEGISGAAFTLSGSPSDETEGVQLLRVLCLPAPAVELTVEYLLPRSKDFDEPST